MARQFCYSANTYIVWAHALPKNHPFATNLLMANMARLDLPRTILDRQTELSGRPLGEHPTTNWGTGGTILSFLIPHKWSATAASTRLAGPKIKARFCRHPWHPPFRYLSTSPSTVKPSPSFQNDGMGPLDRAGHGVCPSS